MNEKRNRRKWTPKERLRIVLETLQSEGKPSEICRREGLSPTLVYQWCKQLLASAEAVYTPKREAREDRRIEKLSAEATRMKNVIAEITAENIDRKKRLGLSDPAQLPAELQGEVRTLAERTKKRSGWPGAGCRPANLEPGIPTPQPEPIPRTPGPFVQGIRGTGPDYFHARGFLKTTGCVTTLTSPLPGGA